jgi:hypothetical protein
MLGEVRVAGVVEGFGEGWRQPGAFAELADREQPGVAGLLAGRRLDDERGAEEVKDLWPAGAYTDR